MKLKETGGKQYLEKSKEERSKIKLFKGIFEVKRKHINKFFGIIKNMKQREIMLCLLLLVLLISTVLKFIFVYYHTDYKNYLGADMSGYWDRATDRFNGDIKGIDQWVIWPPFFHIILTEIFKVIYLFSLLKYKLQIVLGINIILSSVSVLYLYLLTYNFTKKYIVAFCAATLYAFTYYSFYFNAYILSENFGVPIVIAAVYYLLCNKKQYYFLSGVLLAIAAGIRPGFALLGLPFALYALLSGSESLKTNWKQTIFFKGIWKAVLFSTGFFSIFFLIIVENNYISEGKVKGLAASSGVNYYCSFTKCYMVKSTFGYYYVIVPPGSVLNPERGILTTNIPIYDVKSFIKLTNKYIKKHPLVFLKKLDDFRELYFGTLFPSMYNALWFGILIDPFRWLFFILSLVVAFSFFTRPASRLDWKKYLVVLSVILFSLLVCYMFNTEHRYLFPFIFAIYAIAIDTIFEVVSNFRKYIKKLIIFISIVICIPVINAGVLQVKKWRMEDKINVTLINNFHLKDKNNPNTIIGDTSGFNIDAVNFPLNETGFTHKTLGKICHDGSFFINLKGSFEVLQKGLYNFSIYSLDSIEFRVDDITLIPLYKTEEDEKELHVIRDLSKGKHTFRLLYHYYGGNNYEPGIVAMYNPYPLKDEDNKYYLGEDSKFIRFDKLSSKNK